MLEWTLKFTFADREVAATTGAPVFVSAGVAHTYEVIDEVLSSIDSAAVVPTFAIRSHCTARTSPYATRLYS